MPKNRASGQRYTPPPAENGNIFSSVNGGPPPTHRLRQASSQPPSPSPPQNIPQAPASLQRTAQPEIFADLLGEETTVSKIFTSVMEENSTPEIFSGLLEEDHAPVAALTLRAPISSLQDPAPLFGEAEPFEPLKTSEQPARRSQGQKQNTQPEGRQQQDPRQAHTREKQQWRKQQPAKTNPSGDDPPVLPSRSPRGGGPEEGRILPQKPPAARPGKRKAQPIPGQKTGPKAPGSQAKRRRSRRKERSPLAIKKVLKWAALTFCALFVVGVLSLTAFLASSTRNDDLWLDLEQIPYRTETLLLYTDRETGEVLEYTRLPCTQNKVYADGGLMPQDLKDAFVAVEDAKFYTHPGFDFKRTVFAVLNEVKYTLTGSYIGGDDGRKQGASTIDQQLIKNLTRDDENTSLAGYLRKVREIWRAWKMDRDYDKDTILTAYLNTISFTGNTAGVQAEAQKLFGKDVQDLTLPECASLAAITRNPYRFNPVTNPEDHLSRRNYVLAEMLEQGYITQEEYDGAIATPVEITGPGTDPVREEVVTSYFTDAVMDEAVSELIAQRGITRREANDLLYNGGLRIYTTVVPELQSSMERAMESASVYPRPAITVTGPLENADGSPLLDENGQPVIGEKPEYPQGAMVSLDYDGGVCAVVGGLGEKTISRGFNRGMSASRQVGSTMKAISPYVLALEDGTITWSSAFTDAPVTQLKDPETGEMEDWPANVDNTYSNRSILVREAFARSINTIAVQVGETVGNREMYQFVRGELEISSFTHQDAKPGPLVLGSSTYGITPVEMARAYTMFGNGGAMPTVHCFTHIANGPGDELLAVAMPVKQVIGEDTAFLMNRLMREVMVGDGTASGLSVPGEMDSVGKTGTSSDYRDQWFIGLTPYYVTASWYGYDSNAPLPHSTMQPPILAWRSVMQQAQAELPYKEFPAATGVSQHQYCTQSGYAAGLNCPAATGWYADGEPPKEGCPLHG